MGSNSSTVVISLAIAILLVLILLLLLSYNSKVKNDKVERFEGESDYPSYSQMFDPNIAANLNPTMNGIEMPNTDQIKSVAKKDRYLNMDGKMEMEVQGNSEPFANQLDGSPLGDSYSLLSGMDAKASSSSQDPTACFKRDRLTANDLLPTDAASKWSQINPSSSGDLSDQNFLTAGYHIGINTTGQTMRNANLQLRSEIPNPQVAVSPWLISTIEPDVRPVAFEIGSAPTTPPS